MAELAYICVARDDIPNGVLQVLDLGVHFNGSQQNQIYDPPPQTKYLRRFTNDTVVTAAGGGGALSTTAAFTGLAAYLIDHFVAGGAAAGTAALTATEANDAATAVVAIVDAGTALTTTTFNAALSGVVADTEIGGGASTGTLADVLKILGGGTYTVPAGSVVDTDGSTFNAAVSGSFDDTYYRATIRSGEFESSRLAGSLSKLKSASFTYLGTAGAAVTLYAEDGTVL